MGILEMRRDEPVNTKHFRWPQFTTDDFLRRRSLSSIFCCLKCGWNLNVANEEEERQGGDL